MNCVGIGQGKSLSPFRRHVIIITIAYLLLIAY